MKKRYEIILAAGLILTILMSNTMGFIRDGRRLEQLRGSVLRLHILADSDSERDQQLSDIIQSDICDSEAYLRFGSERVQDQNDIAEQEQDRTGGKNFCECGWR